MTGPRTETTTTTQTALLSATALTGILYSLPANIRDEVIKKLFDHIRNSSMQVHDIGNITEYASRLFSQLSYNPIKEVIDQHFPQLKWVLGAAAAVSVAALVILPDKKRDT